jgi:phage recombination protein Bet
MAFGPMSDSYDDYEAASSIQDTYCIKHPGMWTHECGCCGKKRKKINMSTEIQSIQPEWTPEQLDLITRTIAKGASKDELQLFLYRCKNLGLDPLKPGQIYFIKYGNSPGTIVVGIEGFRSRAARTGKLSGIKRGAIRNAAGVLVGAFAEIYRSDWKECAREEVPLSEYNTSKGNWAKMPETMIKKVAEAAALRMAFPDDLGGVYTKEEMDQAEKEYDNRGLIPEFVASGQQKEGYYFPAHMGNKVAAKHIEDVPIEDLKGLVEAIDKKYENKPIPPKTLEAHERAINRILQLEGALDEQVNDDPELFQSFGVVKR